MYEENDRFMSTMFAIHSEITDEEFNRKMFQWSLSGRKAEVIIAKMRRQSYNDYGRQK